MIPQQLTPTEKINILTFSLPKLTAWVGTLGWKPYRAKQLATWLYAKGAQSFDEMTDLSKVARETLAALATIWPLQIVSQQKSLDGTEKFLLQLSDGKRIESVLIPEEDRLTLCVSSQVGCTLDCSFCLTAQQKLQRNLSAHEIVGQVLTVQRVLFDRINGEGTRCRPSQPATYPGITNVVLMGMGEPLANLTQVTEALLQMTAPLGLGFSPRRITVSTAGLVPQMREFLNGPTRANLSVSLNATTNRVRDAIMPTVNRLYPLDQLLAACKEAPLPKRRNITFEYVLLSGINDTPEDAVRLTRLVAPIRCKVNLIPFNEFQSSPYRRPSDAAIFKFQEVLLRAKITATRRKSRGRDILAACGQLSSLAFHNPPISVEHNAYDT